jgi:serine/threonine protein phosphatase PrpC
MRGGVYIGGYLGDAQLPGIGLQMARSLGDADLSRVLERTPEIETVPLGEKGIVLVGSDGLLSPDGSAHSDQLRKLLSLVQKGAEAEGIVADALARGTGDNATAIVWRSKGSVSGE